MEAEENLNYQDIYYLPRALTSMGEDFRKIITDCEGRFASFSESSPFVVGVASVTLHWAREHL